METREEPDSEDYSVVLSEEGRKNWTLKRCTRTSSGSGFVVVDTRTSRSVTWKTPPSMIRHHVSSNSNPKRNAVSTKDNEEAYFAMLKDATAHVHSMLPGKDVPLGSWVFKGDDNRPADDPDERIVRYNISSIVSLLSEGTKVEAVALFRVFLTSLTRANAYVLLSIKSLQVLSRPRGEPEAADEREVADESDLKCIICMDRERSIVLHPCKHLGLCDSCPREGRCLVCRADVERNEKVFVV